MPKQDTGRSLTRLRLATAGQAVAALLRTRLPRPCHAIASERRQNCGATAGKQAGLFGQEFKPPSYAPEYAAPYGARIFWSLNYKDVAPTALEFGIRPLCGVFQSPARGDIFVESAERERKNPLGAAYSGSPSRGLKCAHSPSGSAIAVKVSALLIWFFAFDVFPQPVLQVVPAGAGPFSIIITNGMSGATYELQTTPVLGDTVNYPWTIAAAGCASQTNFTMPAGLSPVAFYRAVLYSNGIPPWETVAPNSYSTNEGEGSAAYPFGESSMHYQQVFAASQLPGAGMITQISFRPDGFFAGDSPRFPEAATSVKVTLATTSKNPADLSTTFVDNFTGTNQTVVYGGTNGAPLNLSTSYTGQPGGPNAFDIRIYLTEPFYYNPANGNLLMDIVLTNANAAFPNFDAVLATNNPLTSRLYGTPATATTGGTDGSAWQGLVTQFTFGNFAVPASTHVGWFISGANVSGISQSNSAIAQHFFNNPNTLIFSSPTANPIPAGFGSATPIAYYTSFGEFQSNLLSNAINPTYQGNWVMYDNEDWTKTPAKEQSSWAAYEALFANLAHAYGYGCFVSPSPDLTGDPQNLPSPTRYDIFLTNEYPAFSASAPADGFNIQGQKLEVPTNGYEQFGWFNSACCVQATNANPAVTVFAGITTTPIGIPSATNLEWAVTNTYNPTNYISGYWFNIPDNNYSLATAALALLENDGL